MFMPISLPLDPDTPSGHVLYNWIGPAIVGAGLLTALIWYLLHRRHEYVMRKIGRDLELDWQMPVDLEGVEDVLAPLFHHVLFLIAGVDRLRARLVGRVEEADVEVISFDAFSVGHFVHSSLDDLVRNGPHPGTHHLDMSRIRGGFGEFTQTVVILHHPAMNLPRFLLLPENYLTRLVPTPESIELDAYPLFLRRNRILGRDQAAIARLFNRNMQVMFERNRDITIEGQGNRLLLYLVGRPLHAHRIQQLLTDGLVMCRAFADVAPQSAQLAADT